MSLRSLISVTNLSWYSLTNRLNLEKGIEFLLSKLSPILQSSSDPPENCHLYNKNCQKLDIFSKICQKLDKKKAKIFDFFKKKCQWHFFLNVKFLANFLTFKWQFSAGAVRSWTTLYSVVRSNSSYPWLTHQDVLKTGVKEPKCTENRR